VVLTLRPGVLKRRVFHLREEIQLEGGDNHGKHARPQSRVGTEPSKEVSGRLHRSESEIALQI
jgi:hypothetical protein